MSGPTCYTCGARTMLSGTYEYLTQANGTGLHAVITAKCDHGSGAFREDKRFIAEPTFAAAKDNASRVALVVGAFNYPNVPFPKLCEHAASFCSSLVKSPSHRLCPEHDNAQHEARAARQRQADVDAGRGWKTTAAKLRPGDVVEGPIEELSGPRRIEAKARIVVVTTTPGDATSSTIRVRYRAIADGRYGVFTLRAAAMLHVRGNEYLPNEAKALGVVDELIAGDEVAVSRSCVERKLGPVITPLDGYTDKAQWVHGRVIEVAPYLDTTKNEYLVRLAAHVDGRDQPDIEVSHDDVAARIVVKV